MNKNINYETAGKLLLHIGGPKTGSTALQNMLYQNHISLREKSIFYDEPFEPTSNIQSGNGLPLFNLVRNGGSKTEVRKLLILNRRQNGLSIISSEFFVIWSRENWKLFFECALDLEIEVKLLLYIRSPADYSISSYIQSVKRAGETSEFETYLQSCQWLHADVLRNLSDIGYESSATVIPYDNVKEQISKSFWQNVGTMFEMDIDITNLISSDAKTWNRSLDQMEINLVKEINKLFGDQYSQLISDFLITEFPSSGNEMVLPRTSLEAISKRWEGEILWINQTFFAGKDILQVSSNRYLLDDSLPDVRNEVNGYPDPSILVQMIFYLLRNFGSEANRLMNLHLTRILKDLGEAEYLEKMDDGDFFDVVYYVLLNPDVLNSSCAPMEHFNNWGKTEGRSWRKRKMSRDVLALSQPQNVGVDGKMSRNDVDDGKVS